MATDGLKNGGVGRYRSTRPVDRVTQSENQGRQEDREKKQKEEETEKSEKKWNDCGRRQEAMGRATRGRNEMAAGDSIVSSLFSIGEVETARLFRVAILDLAL